MIQLTHAARTGTFTVYDLKGAKITVRDTEGVPFLPQAVAINLTPEGEIEKISLVGHAALAPSERVYNRDFSREDVTTEYTGDDMAQHMELDLVAEILMASLRADGVVVDTVPAHLI